MMKRVEYLLNNSGLPGPRSNLSLMYSFAHGASEEEVNQCLTFLRDDLGNSPEEFVAVCGIVGFCILHGGNMGSMLDQIRKYASHGSWRIREAVAMGIQETAEGRMDEVLQYLENWMDGNDLEKRAVVAALCEPKLLKGDTVIRKVSSVLTRLTLSLDRRNERLSEAGKSLRKALGYGWSVVIVSLPEEGKGFFKEIARNKHKDIQWIVKENLKKNRLSVMDAGWVKSMLTEE